MARELRPRKTRPSYAALYKFGSDDEGDDGGDDGADKVHDVDSASGSDFELPAGEGEADDVIDVDEVGSEEEDEDDADADADENSASIPFPQRSKKKATRALPKSKKKNDGALSIAAASKRHSVVLAPGLTRPPNRQMHAPPLPLPNIDHRHRPEPIYLRTGRVERLTHPPTLFGPNPTVPTQNCTSNPVVRNRVNKAWGQNVGPGPIWELLEDRAWWKEAVFVEGEEEKEKYRRPRVYEDIQLREDHWSVLGAEDAIPYLPSDIVTNADGSLKPPPPVTCSFGPHDNQTRKQMSTFDVLALSEIMPGNKSHVLNAGAPVWGLDWCPIYADDAPSPLYLAIAPFPSRAHSPEIGRRVSRPSHACIQIWSLSPATASDDDDDDEEEEKDGEKEDAGRMKCEMVLCLESGPAFDLKWCPLPSHDNLKQTKKRKKKSPPRKLGILAGTFEDGSLSLYAVPNPLDITPPTPTTTPSPSQPQPLFVRLAEPLLRIEMDETTCWSLDWANSEVIAVGCTNGSVAVYNISQALRNRATHPTSTSPPTSPPTPLLPTHHITPHQSAIRALAWIRSPPSSSAGVPQIGEDPRVLATGGCDGVECLVDVRELRGFGVNRTRDVINCLSFSAAATGSIGIDGDNIIKVFSVSPTMLGRGHSLMETAGPVWSLDTSDYHAQLAVGSADGTCMTTNTLKSTRRGGAVPFLEYRIYQMDYSRELGEYRMLEQFLPQEIPDPKAKKNNTSTSTKYLGTGSWPREVGVHRVRWNSGSGLGRAPLLASATASGLCRVDWLLGRWLRDKFPYGSVENIRMEYEVGEGGVEENDDELEED